MAVNASGTHRTWIGAIGSAALLLVGCAPHAHEAQGESSSRSGPAPNFSGPWAADFASAFERAASDFEREVLADGTLTDQELSESRERFSDCLRSFGFSEISFGSGSDFEFMAADDSDPDVVNGQVEDCQASSGQGAIGALHEWVHRNPDNLDENTIMAACLVGAGAVDPSYDAQRYAADMADPDFPNVESFDLIPFQECHNDPLGLFK